MTTLHDLLKDTRTHRDERAQNVDLRGHYNKIGLSAVAAAAPYRSAAEDCKRDHQISQAMPAKTRQQS